MLENDCTKLVQHILPYTLSRHNHDAQFPTAVCRLLPARFTALRCGLNRCIHSVATVKRLNHWHRMWRNHRRGRSFWQHPKGYWFPQGISAGVIAVLLWFWTMVYREPHADIPDVGALIGLALGLAMLALQLFRFYKNKPEWTGKHRSWSIAFLVFLIAFVALMGWSLIRIRVLSLLH